MSASNRSGPVRQTPNWPGLNWKEIELLATRLAPQLEGLFLDRLIVPARPRHPQGYIKGEWSLRFTGRKSELAFLFSVRPRHPYFALYPERGPQAAAQATHSPFDLALSKHLRELKLLKLWVPRRERIVVLDFERKMRLVLVLIPSAAEALLVEITDAKLWPVIARSRTLKSGAQAARGFELPDGARAPEDPAVRPELTEPESFQRELESWLESEAFGLRVQSVEKIVREKMKATRERLRQSEVARDEARQEPDWQRYGDLLKSAIGTLREAATGEREVTDYATGMKVSVPCDPRLGLRAQIQKFYLHSRRKQRRLSEATHRIETFSETLRLLEDVATRMRSLSGPSGPNPTERPDWAELERIEALAGAGLHSQAQARPHAGSKHKGGWLGRSAQSRDGWSIWIGKSRDENLELTFKHARGNDLWMHVRGRPGAHVLIPVQPGKTVPLETLLDAANLAIFYSGGESWGKTEVDYTFKKHVKRIKDSTEASYTHNKTLIVELDRARLKRLLGEKS